MTTVSETSSFSRDNLKRNQEPYEKSFITAEEKRKRNMEKLNDEKNEYTQEKQSLKSWKNQDFCKVHSSKTAGKNDSRDDHFKHQEKGDVPKNILDDDSNTIKIQPDSPTHFQVAPTISKDNDDHEIIETDVTASDILFKVCERFSKSDHTNTNTNNSKNTSEVTDVSLIASEGRVEGECLFTEENDEPISETEDSNFEQFPSSLPDILNTLQSSPSMGSANIETCIQSESAERSNLVNERKSKSTAYVPHPFSSDSFSNETEAELKKLRTLQSLQANRSIYKLAYDENITDQSNSRSPSPVDPESQVPSSIPNSEILIHEAGSDSEAGSEDVELISHRYESETSLNENKHMYVNKLSLAVELLRTQESLPYDEQFKRVVAVKETKKDTTGEVNFAFVEDSYPMDSFGDHVVVTAQSEASRHLYGEVSESCEMAKEVVEAASNPICKMCSVS